MNSTVQDNVKILCKIREFKQLTDRVRFERGVNRIVLQAQRFQLLDDLKALGVAV